VVLTITNAQQLVDLVLTVALIALWPLKLAPQTLDLTPPLCVNAFLL